MAAEARRPDDMDLLHNRVHYDGYLTHMRITVQLTARLSVLLLLKLDPEVRLKTIYIYIYIFIYIFIYS